ncbi:MAG: TetR/AcrR family transcriptional regulator [Chloroflexota bacterium]
MVSIREKTTVRQRQIIDAARKTIIKYGSEHVTVRRIAEEIGVSEGAIYRHFKSKRDILTFLIEDIENTLLCDIESLPLSSPLTLAILEETMATHMASVVQRRGVSFQVIAEIVSFGDKKLNRQVFDVIDSYTDRIKHLLSEGVKAGIIRQGVDLKTAAFLFFGMTQGLVNSWTLSQYSFNLEEEYASLWRLFREAVIRH